MIVIVGYRKLGGVCSESASLGDTGIMLTNTECSYKDVQRMGGDGDVVLKRDTGAIALVMVAILQAM